MSQDLSKNNNNDLPQKSTANNSEEIDLLVLFNLIGGLFNRLFNFVSSIIKKIFSTIIYALRAFIDNWKLIGGVMLVSGAIGYVLEASKPTIYSSGMLVQPYFDSKYQLVTNINYFNELISNEDYKSLESIFEIPSDDVETLVAFKIDPGPENENDRILQYNDFLKKIDSSRAKEISYEDYIENRSIYSGNVFLITAESQKKDVFRSLEKGIASGFTNDFSKSERQKRDSLIVIQKQNLMDQIHAIDSLKGIYIEVLKEDSKASAKQIKLGDIPLTSQNKTTTREFELLNKEIALRNELGKLDEQKIEENTYFDVISSFQQVGSKVDKLTEKYSLIFPIVAFILLCLYFIFGKSIDFIKRYND